MDLCIKTQEALSLSYPRFLVSILVLMDLCIKTYLPENIKEALIESFNPCFNGSMYKNDMVEASNYFLYQFQSLF